MVNLKAPSTGSREMPIELVDSGKRLSDRQSERASGTQLDVETLKTLVVCCAVGLVVALFLAEGITFLGVMPDNNGWDIIGCI
jgi:predicted metal-binding protein